jgi:hypothetical protein
MARNVAATRRTSNVPPAARKCGRPIPPLRTRSRPGRRTPLGRRVRAGGRTLRLSSGEFIRSRGRTARCRFRLSKSIIRSDPKPADPPRLRTRSRPGRRTRPGRRVRAGGLCEVVAANLFAPAGGRARYRIRISTGIIRSDPKPADPPRLRTRSCPGRRTRPGRRVRAGGLCVVVAAKPRIHSPGRRPARCRIRSGIDPQR